MDNEEKKIKLVIYLFIYLLIWKEKNIYLELEAIELKNKIKKKVEFEG